MCNCLSVYVLFCKAQSFLTYACYLICGVDLVTYLIRVGCVGGYGGREKCFVSEMQIEKY